MVVARIINSIVVKGRRFVAPPLLLKRYDTEEYLIVGYLCTRDGNIYFANLFEFRKAKKETIIQSGENILYSFKNGKLTPLAEICFGYAPAALTYWHDCFYMISAGYGMVQCFSQQEENLDTLLVLPKASQHMYMDIDEAGNMYVIDVENKCFYVAEKQEG